MKRIFLIYIMSAILALPAVAQEANTLTLGLFGGFTSSMNGDRMTVYNPGGPNVGGLVGYRLADHFSVDFFGEYSYFPMKDITGYVRDNYENAYLIYDDFEGGDLRLLTFGADFKVYIIPGFIIDPYILAGPSFSFYTRTDIEGSRPISEARDVVESGRDQAIFGMFAGAGFDLNLLENLAFFGQARYQGLFMNDDRDKIPGFVPLQAGIKLKL